MKFNAPDRPRLANGRFAWKNSNGMIALPDICVVPGEGARWGIRLMNGGNGRWYSCSFIGLVELNSFLERWRKNPEWTFESYFVERAPVRIQQVQYGGGGEVKETITVKEEVEF